VNENEIREIEERAGLAADALEDPEVVRRYATKAAQQDVPELVEALRKAYAASGGGGDLGHLLRNALKARLVKQTPDGSTTQRLATLSEDVEIHSLNVSAINGEPRVIVDVRLMVGDKPVLR
jgi:hypothetical protein